MKKYIPIALTCIATFCLSGCGGKKQDAAETKTALPRYLVIYYSQTGATQTVAKALQHCLNADMEAIELEDPYSRDYDLTIERCQKERAQGISPKIKPIRSDLQKYDVIFLGYPVWFGTYALPITTLLKEVDFSGKKVVPFCTFGSGGLESSESDLRKVLSHSEVGTGFGIRQARIASLTYELTRYLVEQQYAKGNIETYPDYSEQQPITEEEKALFEAATGSYQFPLGVPVTVGKRTTSRGTDYKFTAQTQGGPYGKTDVTIYVTVSNNGNSQPEFTKVVR